MTKKKILKLSLKDIHNLYVPLSILLDEQINKTDLKVWCYVKLIEIQEIICEVTQEELAEIMNTNKTTVGKSIVKLIEKGYLNRYRKENALHFITETIN